MITDYFQPTEEEPIARVGTQLFWRGKDGPVKKYSQKLLDGWAKPLTYYEYLAGVYHWSDGTENLRKESLLGGSKYMPRMARRITCPW